MLLKQKWKIFLILEIIWGDEFVRCILASADNCGATSMFFLKYLCGLSKLIYNFIVLWEMHYFFLNTHGYRSHKKGGHYDCLLQKDLLLIWYPIKFDLLSNCQGLYIHCLDMKCGTQWGCNIASYSLDAIEISRMRIDRK